VNQTTLNHLERELFIVLTKLELNDHETLINKYFIIFSLLANHLHIELSKSAD